MGRKGTATYTVGGGVGVTIDFVEFAPTTTIIKVFGYSIFHSGGFGDAKDGPSNTNLNFNDGYDTVGTGTGSSGTWAKAALEAGNSISGAVTGHHSTRASGGTERIRLQARWNRRQTYFRRFPFPVIISPNKIANLVQNFSTTTPSFGRVTVYFEEIG